MHSSIIALAYRTEPCPFPCVVAYCCWPPCAVPSWLRLPSQPGKANCRIAPIRAPSATDVSWTGACAEGYASGKGVLAWRENDGDVNIEATLVRGEVSGNVVVKTPGYTYKGTLQAGIPHGQGYFQFASADGEYEGEVVAGKPHGKGEKLDADRSYYTGEWAEGKRNGYGEAVFTVGGSYKGQWKDDKYHGKGTIVYAGSGRSYEGLFEDDRVAGLPAPEIQEGHYAIRVPTNGSHIREESIVSKLPLTAGWNALTHAQKTSCAVAIRPSRPATIHRFRRKGKAEYSMPYAVSAWNSPRSPVTSGCTSWWTRRASPSVSRPMAHQARGWCVPSPIS